jgi:predicted esterase
MLQNIFKLCLFLFLITGCSTASSSFAIKASKSGFKSTQIQGLNYQHNLYKNKSSKNRVLHVYLGGDGTPWFKGRYITRDPTPLKPIMLDLMKLDQTASIYLGRPCYHQYKMPSNCDNALWTNKRYSPIIVNSMVTALKRYIKQHNISKVNLFGFSGGGTLAMLLAPQLKEVNAVITLAGNLDTDAWTTHHGYSPLFGSLNPALQPALPTNIQQFHYIGEDDKNILIKLIKPVIEQQKNARLIVIKQTDHHCCWLNHWQKILESTIL